MEVGNAGAEFEEGLNSFYTGKPAARFGDVCLGASDQTVAGRDAVRNEALLNELDDLVSSLDDQGDDEVPENTKVPSPADIELTPSELSALEDDLGKEDDKDYEPKKNQ